MKSHCGIEKEVARFIGIALLVCITGGLIITYKRNGDSLWIKDLALVLAGGLIALLTSTRPQTPAGTQNNPISTVTENTKDHPVIVAPIEEEVKNDTVSTT